MSPSKIQINKYYFRESFNYNFIYYFYKKSDRLYYFTGRLETTRHEDGPHYYIDCCRTEDRNDMPYDIYALKDKTIINEFNKKMTDFFVTYIKGCFTGENSFTPYYLNAIGNFPSGRHSIIREIFL